MVDIKGVIPALITPSDSEGRPDISRIADVLRFTLDRGVHGMFVGGSTGEGFCLSTQERKDLAQAVVQEIAGRVPVVIHVGSMRFREVLELSAHAQEIGADAVSSVLPFYYSYSLEEVRDYYQAISQASELPTIIYALSQVESTVFPPQEFVDAIMTIDRIYGIKFTNKDLNRLQIIDQLSGKRLRFYGGVDVLALPMFVMGVSGIIGSNYSGLPEPWTALYEAFLKGDLDRARAIQDRLTHYIRAFRHVQGSSRAKGLLRLRNVDAGESFLPTGKLKPSDMEILKGVMDEVCRDPVLKDVMQVSGR